MTEFFNTLGDAGKMKWIDAIARSMGNSTDPQEINRSVFDKKYGSNDLDFNVELTGGDPINNQGTWTVLHTMVHCWTNTLNLIM